MSVAPWSVRLATIDDIEAIVDLRIAGWRAAYSHAIPSEFLDRMEQRRDREIAGRRTSFDAEGQTQYVAESDGRIVGWGLAGPQTDDDRPAELQLYSLYVDADLHGSGVASALLKAVLGTEPATLWVLGDNPRARAFYSREGFVADGASQMLDGELSHIPEIRMVRLAS